MASDYITADDLKDNLDPKHQQFKGTEYDDYINGLITRASRMIDRYTKREPGAYAVIADTTRYFNGPGSARLLIDEIAASPTALAVSESGKISSTTDYTAYPSTDYYMIPYNAAALSVPYTAIELDILNGSKSTFYGYKKGILITGPFGYAEGDTDGNCEVGEIIQATIIQAARFFKRGLQAFQDVGAIEALAQLRYVKAIDPEAASIISTIKRVSI